MAKITFIYLLIASFIVIYESLRLFPGLSVFVLMRLFLYTQLPKHLTPRRCFSSKNVGHFVEMKSKRKNDGCTKLKECLTSLLQLATIIFPRQVARKIAACKALAKQ